MTLIILIALLIFLLAICAFFSASEMALFSLSSMKVKAFKQDPDPKKRRVADLLYRPSDLLVTLIILVVISSILIQNVVSNIFGTFSGWGLKVGVPLALTLVFGEIIPKSIGLANNESVSIKVAPVLLGAQKLFYPLRKALMGIVNVLSRFFFLLFNREKDISVDELKHALASSRRSGVLNEEEAEVIRGFLHLQESTVKEQMRPREEVIFFDIDDPLSKLVHFFVDLECSRIPVCKENLDNVIGVITSQQFFLRHSEIHESSDLLPILKKPFFAPEATPADTLLKQLYEKQEEIAIVVDEYGAVSGLISLEDLVEIVIGEIADLRDEKSRYTRSAEDVVIASGRLELDEFEQIFGVALESPNHMVTIGGWLTEQIGDIPKVGTKYVTDDFLFHVLAADPKRVRRVYIRRLKQSGKRKP